MIVKLLTEHLFEFLSLKGGCRGSSESTHVKMPHCWKSHVTAQIKCTKLLIAQASLLDYRSNFSIRLTLFVSMNFYHLLRYIECALATLCRCARSSAQGHLRLPCSPTHTCDVMDTRFCDLSLRLSLGKAESRQT